MANLKRINIGGYVKADVVGDGTWDYGVISGHDKKADTVTFTSVFDNESITINRDHAMKATRAEVEENTNPRAEVVVDEAPVTYKEDMARKDAELEEVKLEVEEIEAEAAKASRSIVPEHYRATYTRTRVNNKTHVDNNDGVAQSLRGQSLETVYEVASEVLKETVMSLRAQYEHLNPGQQRMVLGNRIRRAG